MIKMGNLTAAKALYEEAIKLSPGYAVAYNNLGYVMIETGNLTAAKAIYEKAIALSPNSFEPYIGLGNCYLEAKDYRMALLMYDRSLAINPYNAEAHYNIALIYERVGNPNETRYHYQEFVRLAGTEYKDKVEAVKLKLAR